MTPFSVIDYHGATKSNERKSVTMTDTNPEGRPPSNSVSQNMYTITDPTQLDTSSPGTSSQIPHPTPRNSNYDKVTFIMIIERKYLSRTGLVSEQTVLSPRCERETRKFGLKGVIKG